MGIFGDIEEIKKFWNQVSWKGRILIIISAFFSFSSLASLSDTIFKWKGFILEGILLYRKLTTFLLILPFGKINISITPAEADFIVFISMTISLQLRQAGLTMKSVSKKEYGLFFFHYFIPLIRGRLLQLLLFTLFFFLIYYIVADVTNILWSLFSSTFVIAVSPLIHCIQTKQWNLIVSLYGPILLGLLLVFVLAAINAGLSKPYIGP